jgi:hypothetical protein
MGKIPRYEAQDAGAAIRSVLTRDLEMFGWLADDAGVVV